MQKWTISVVWLMLLLWGAGLGSGLKAAAKPSVGFQTSVESSAPRGAQADLGNRGNRRMRAVRRLLADPEVREGLGITQDQLERLEATAFDARRRGIELRAELQRRRLELRRLSRQDPPDRAALDEAVRMLGEARTELQRERLQRRLDAREILTPEQREGIRQLLREERRERRARQRRP